MDGAFSGEEIKSVIQDLPSDHYPGPDGFNGCFFKKVLGHYWTLHDHISA